MKREYKIINMDCISNLTTLVESLNKLWKEWWEFISVINQSYIVLKKPKLD
jgi:hypothetical protein